MLIAVTLVILAAILWGIIHFWAFFSMLLHAAMLLPLLAGLGYGVHSWRERRHATQPSRRSYTDIGMRL